MRRHLLLAAVLSLAAIECTSNVFPSGTHAWGTYHVCTLRVTDTCHPPEQTCTTQPLQPVTLAVGVSDDGQTFRIVRDSAPLLEGKQLGTHFEVTHDVTNALGVQDTFCGCAADITETIRGELLPSSPGNLYSWPACGVDAGVLDGGTGPGCVDDGGLNAYDNAEWLGTADGGGDLSQTYAAVQGRVIDQVRAAPGANADGGCSCLPCTIEYDFVGTE